MGDRSVVIIGLPESGKTTYLAALWHSLTSRDLPTRLSFANLLAGTTKHLNAIASRWRDAKEQDRTLLHGSTTVAINLSEPDGKIVRITFPDVPGEEYRQMWEEREISLETMDTLRADGVLLFVNADAIHAPNWIVDENAMYESWGQEIIEGKPIEWNPRAAPTQVQLVDLLQLLRMSPINIGQRRLAIVLSLWDKVREEGRTPAKFLSEQMPLLDQYLRHSADDWTYVVYGISAQGGVYDAIEPDAEKSEEAEELRHRDKASTRVDVVLGTNRSHDLTEPLAWLME